MLTDQDSPIAGSPTPASWPTTPGLLRAAGLQRGPSIEPLNIFELQAGSFDLESSTARLVITNGIGADVQAFIQQLEVSNTGSASRCPCSMRSFGGPVNVSRAVDLNGGFQTTTYTAVMDDGNSTSPSCWS